MPIRIEKGALLEDLESVFFELAGDAMLIVDLSDARIVDANRAACELYGYEWQDLRNCSIMDIEALENQPMVMERITQLIQDQQTRFESIHKSKNGNLIPVEINVRIVRHQRKTYALSICRDVSENKKLSSDLLRRKRQLAEAQAIAHIGSWEYNPEIGLSDWSEELYRIYGVDPANFTPSVKSLLELVHIEDRPLLQGWVDACLAGKKVSTLEFRVIRPDGTLRYIEAQGRLFRDSADTTRRMAGTSRDITERKSVELKLLDTMRILEERNLNKSRFLAAAGHDLRQPLTAANLFIGALKASKLTPGQQKIIGNLDLAMTNLNELLSSLLNTSRLEAGVIIPACTSVDVPGLLGWLSSSFKPLALECNLEFSIYQPAKRRLHVYADPGLLKTVLSNLVSNAIKFTMKGGVLVSARPRGDKVLFQIWDSGTGIPPESIDRVFEEFFQLDNPQRDMSRGIGLGLSIAKRALSLMNTDLSCRSRVGDGPGTVFEFMLPLAEAVSETSAQESAARLQAKAECARFVRGKRFVVVEDDPLISDAFSLALRSMGGSAKCFRTAEDAIAHAASQDADCYIMDQMLAGRLSGIQCLDRIREMRGGAVLAVILTGDTSHEFIAAAERSDWPIMYKPAELHEIITRLCHLDRTGDRKPV